MKNYGVRNVVVELLEKHGYDDVILIESLLYYLEDTLKENCALYLDLVEGLNEHHVNSGSAWSHDRSLALPGK
ncbi:hypothetical protein [Bacillus weihaiensis]|uniref:hypothetical protein n=1 Tax=Bacillus weihaiensis TaxID=1547283 RepID=UPI002355B423|nr:hypothetical protein [Bacillus weihaiensis]